MNIYLIRHGEKVEDSNYGTIRSMVCGMLNIPQTKRFYLGFPPEYCSITHIIYENNEFYVHSFNDYSHLK